MNTNVNSDDSERQTAVYSLELCLSLLVLNAICGEYLALNKTLQFGFYI